MSKRIEAKSLLAGLSACNQPQHCNSQQQHFGCYLLEKKLKYCSFNLLLAEVWVAQLVVGCLELFECLLSKTVVVLVGVQTDL